ncbi:calcium-binding protein [Planotetraspora thailandica]|uniref:Calcium-binding protein n=1 Tax=Planotetraspora thailandica TaxID=487172 RepID=A0A8J4DEG7_9ACTN|nr:EF-hand domain-containing protein [Planotetraspora thailandica]GII59234.1 calcium-binding protein [Planotetraspora thailandica]
MPFDPRGAPVTRSLRESNVAALFALLDSTGDGQIAADDFKRIADGACAALALDPGSRQHQALQQLCADWWEHIREDADLDGDAVVSESEFIKAVDHLVASHPQFQQMTLALSCAGFDAADIDEDGFISAPELDRLFSALGIPHEVAEGAFAQLDTDGDGRISRQEYAEGVWVLITSEDPDTPGSAILGQTRVG